LREGINCVAFKKIRGKQNASHNWNL
jgi:hypothetical protein